ncbi:MAG: PTS sugar transporter subunit IIA [Candidatus Hydrogenedentes bacterium]|nr:PTS sugar transporter subunit IIA [Candidatus Hydrogenedentota bacterium]
MSNTSAKADAFMSMIRRSQRGRLKIYLGYCAGVGKTYQMLQEAHRMKSEGIDVVVGLVETHGRADTAKLVDGLEVMERRRTECRGITIDEMDSDAILERKPAVVLIDELAHTNAPGSKNQKRYQDVQDILAAGIHVITTLNVQHLESLYDTVEHSLNVKVRERLPDSVLAEADQLVNVDLTTEDLQKRLNEGKVYPKERIAAAQGNFFVPANLEQLRELTLRELASQIDLRRREPADDAFSTAPDQVMVCLSSGGPNSEMLLRYASRLAGRLNRNWYAVYVQTPAEEPTAIDARTQRVLSGVLTLAKQLGALVFTYKGEDVPDTILRFAREYRVGHIIIGSPAPTPMWKRLLGRRGTVERLLQEARGVTVVVLDTRKGRPATALPPDEQNHAASAGEKQAGPPILLGGLLKAENIRIWDEPVFKQEVINALILAVCKRGESPSADEIRHAVFEREEQGSTFFNEGAAFPHARVTGLATPLVALGITRRGVVDASVERPVECVFLIVAPAEQPNVQLQILSLASRASQDRHLRERIASARSAADALVAIWDWEGR